MVETTMACVEFFEEDSCIRIPSAVSIQETFSQNKGRREEVDIYLMSFDMRTKGCSPALCALMHFRAIPFHNGSVDNKRGSPKGANVRTDERIAKRIFV